jgi:hypothetical protein
MCMLINSCGKGKSESAAPTVYSPLDSTRELAGTWRIRGYEDSSQIDVFNSTFTLNDTSISIAVVNDSTLSIGSCVAKYLSTSSDDSILYFWYIAPAPDWLQVSVSYYYYKDSIFFDQLRLVTPNGYVENRYHSY